MADKTFYAHSGNQTDRGDWQLLPDHLNQTAGLAAQRGHALRLAATAHLAGAYHDLGKYDPAFDRILRGEKVRVDHSTAGAKLLLDRAPPQMKPLAEMLAYIILGHHAGLPDRQGTDSALSERTDSHSYRIPQTILDACQPDLTAAATEVLALIRKVPYCGFDASVATRMAFSCLVDADFRDTEAFYASIKGMQPDRVWPALPALLPQLRAAFDGRITQFIGTTDLNQLRSNILTHVRAQAPQRPGLFTLTVPTGGGKTLASMGFALDHAAAHGHRRIIYAIPYTSIIDQTAKQFRDMFGEHVVLEHHSAIDIEKMKEDDADSRDKMRLAMEDWAAPIVVTTNVQLFESLFAARPSRCRKLHNIAGSVIVLDEAQALPRKLLLPTLRMIDTLAHHYGCTIVLCTATQPAFDSRQLKGGGLALEGRELAPNPEMLANRLRRARIVQGDVMDDGALIAALRPHPQALVIVNSRKHALTLFRQAQTEGLDGLVHLTTRQFPAHRRRILERVKERLKAGLPCRLIATSLVEAGVDFDFPIGWRAEAGLDSVVQAAGRINREGKRDWQDSTLTVFTAPDNPAPTEVATLAKAMRSTARKFDDLLSPAAIQDWFDEVYWKAQPVRLGSKMAECFLLGRSTDFPFRSIAEAYQMIDSPMVPVIISLDDKAAEAVRELAIEKIPSGKLARALQSYTVQISLAAREIMRANGKGSFHHPALRGDQFFVLDEPSLYHEETGLHWEDAEYLGEENWIV